MSRDIPTLNSVQKKAVDYINRGRNVFITGGAGVGKSYVITHIRSCLTRTPHAIVAPTGAAALLVNGFTIHKYFALPINADECTHGLLDVKLTRDQKANIRELRMLIVDEVSMVHKNVLDMIDRVCRSVRYSNDPFGGIQVVLVGDFMQLAPITDLAPDEAWAFCASVWSRMNLEIVNLDQPHRQESEEFVLLSCIRMGVAPESRGHNGLNRCFLPPSTTLAKISEKYADWTVLFAMKAKMERYNQMMNDRLLKDNPLIKTFTFTAQPPGVIKGNVFASVPGKVELREGTRVMVIRNIDDMNLVNGDTGVLERFHENRDGVWPVVKIDRTGDEKVITNQVWTSKKLKRKHDKAPLEWVTDCSITQIPLVLGWATTIHKAQGATIDRLVVDLSNVFCCGQAYVALSRCKSLDNLKILGYDPKCIMASERASAFTIACSNFNKIDDDSMLKKLEGLAL